MHKKLVLLLGILLLSLACVLSSCTNGRQSAEPAATGDKVITIKLAHELADDHPWGAACLKFKEIVESESNNTIKVDIFGNGQLGGSSREIQESVKIGALEMGISSTPLEIINPYQKIVALPYLFASKQQAWEILDSSLGERIAAHAEAENVKVLAYWEDGMRQITNNKRPINVPEDLHGIKLRVPESAVRLATFEALNASPVSMPWSEVFTSLQQGTIDGQENPLSVIYTASFYECQKYLSLTNHVYSAAGLLINLNLWNELSAEQQQIVQRAAEVARDLNRELNDVADQNLISQLEEKGMIVNEIADVSLFQDQMQPVWDSVLEELGEEGQALFAELRTMQ